MLKLIYTESGFYLERFTNSSIEDWIKARLLLHLRAGATLFVEPTTASFLLPVDLPYLADLEALKQEDEEILDIYPCDEDHVEISLEGTWLASQEESESGIFVCAMSDRAEYFLYKLWKEAQIGASVISD